MDTKQKTQTIINRYERTRQKRKRILKTTLINTPKRQMDIIKILLSRSGLKVNYKMYGNHQQLTVTK